MKKILSVLLTIFVVIASFTPVFALDQLGPEKGQSGITDSNGGAFVGKILGIVQFIGYAIAIGMLIYVGVKYVMASANEKADLKNAMIKYVIGAILIAGASTIAGWIYSIGASA